MLLRRGVELYGVGEVAENYAMVCGMLEIFTENYCKMRHQCTNNILRAEYDIVFALTTIRLFFNDFDQTPWKVK